MGLFNPEAAVPALVCINMMEFEGKESIKQQIMQNSMVMQQMQQMQQALMTAEQFLPGIMAQAGLVNPMMGAPAPMPEPGPGPSSQFTAEERAARKDGDSTLAAKARLKAANAASI